MNVMSTQVDEYRKTIGKKSWCWVLTDDFMLNSLYYANIDLYQVTARDVDVSFPVITLEISNSFWGKYVKWSIIL